MIVFVSGATATHRRYADTGYFGHLLTPSNGSSMAAISATGCPWACDNDFFWKPDPTAFRRLLAKVTGQPGCRFIPCPDVVGDAVATLARFAEWQGEVAATGRPVALVGQDGAEDLDLPWDRFAALFIGGSTGWKESRTAMDLCDEARRRKKWVHVGRVNTLRRLRKVWDWGSVDSIDGTCFSKWPDKFFPWFIGHVRRLESQAVMWRGE